MIETIAGGRYRVERTLGRGGMATVYRAHDTDLDRPVALKVLAEHLAADDDFLARFVREARLASRLSHPNVVRVYDAGESDGRPFIVMELVPGASLANAGRLPPARVVELGLQACAGLQHAHDAGVVHRDVKPANVLLRDDGVVKIADFGIARAADTTRHTQAGSVLGTAAYLAPEQVGGHEATFASDVYALGAVLYELLTGRPPYTFTSLAELAAKQSDGVIVPVRDIDPSIPADVEGAVMHALAREPGFRPASPAELAHELAGTAQATRALPARRSISVPGRSGAGWIAAAIALAAVSVAVGLAKLGGGDSSPAPPPPHVSPPVRGTTATEQARNLARWLRAHSR